MLPPHSSLPEAFAWPLWALTATVTALRLRWCADTFANRQINVALVGSTIAWLLLIESAQHRLGPLHPLLSPARQYQLANALMIVVMAAAYLMISHTRQRNPPAPLPVYTAAVLLGLGYLILGDVVVDGGGIVLQYPGWQAAPMTVFFVVFPYACAVLIVAACIQELRARPPLGARLFYGLFLAIFTGLIGSLSFGLTTSLILATGRVNGFTEYAAHTDRMAFVVDIIAFTPLAAIPLALRAVDAVRGDPTARAITDLTPLWADLTRVCPEVVQPRPDHADATYRLHRMVIEINDAVLALSPYVPSGTRHGGPGATAPLLAAAAAAKLAGAPPDSAAPGLDLPGGEDLQTETRILSALAKEWSTCRPSLIHPGASRS
ncbi:MAB_1171c family putative transporter [Nocardia crassostreae]|uniref:MAB_1171c family putative transporter n=1 Tax=Nocardia crassostreae TaxID=53428 RepID=UPI00082E66CC|nr:MAB_1171c family putative transporter [Nocardia crassostreae]